MCIFARPFENNDAFIIYNNGPLSEFKNKFTVTLVAMLSKKFDCKVHWKYFATSHGKGVVDGIEGEGVGGGGCHSIAFDITVSGC